MTIGPEPMIRMRFRSVRFGIGVRWRAPRRLLLHQPVDDRHLRRGFFSAIQDIVETAAADPRDLAAVPQLLAEHADAPVDALADRVRLERGLALRRERRPLRLLAAAFRPPVRDQVLGHDGSHPPLRAIRSVNRWKRWLASCGPGEASGWYCTEKTGHSRCRRPSQVVSLRFVWVGSQPSRDTDSGPTAKPWFCAVISTLPVARSFTGWLAPWWPNGSLYVRPPAARPRIWWPRQMPKIGTRPSSPRTDSIR